MRGIIVFVYPLIFHYNFIFLVTIHILLTYKNVMNRILPWPPDYSGNWCKNARAGSYVTKILQYSKYLVFPKYRIGLNVEPKRDSDSNILNGTLHGKLVPQLRQLYYYSTLPRAFSGMEIKQALTIYLMQHTTHHGWSIICSSTKCIESVTRHVLQIVVSHHIPIPN